MSCYIILYDLSDQNKETGRPFGRCLPIPFVSNIEADEYLKEHEELWIACPMFAYGTWEPTEEDLEVWDKFCKKIDVLNPLRRFSDL